MGDKVSQLIEQLIPKYKRTLHARIQSSSRRRCTHGCGWLRSRSATRRIGRGRLVRAAAAYAELGTLAEYNVIEQEHGIWPDSDV